MSPELRANCKSGLQVADENHGTGPKRLAARNCRQLDVARFATTAFLEPLQKTQRLTQAATVKESLTVHPKGKREIRRPAKLYNRDLLDAVTAKNYVRAEEFDQQAQKKGSGDAS